MIVGFEKVDFKLPAFKHEKGDAGYDLYYAGENTVIKTGEYYAQNENEKIPKLMTNIKLRMPGNIYAEVKNRSGTAGDGLLVLTGTIDPNYRGIVQVQCIALFKDIEIKKGDRIAQIVFGKFEEPDLLEAKINPNETERGEKGFGSSGK